MPTAISGGVVGFVIRGGGSNLDFHHNVTDGGANLLFFEGVRLSGLTLGNVDLHDNALAATGSAYSTGIVLNAVGTAAGVKIRDNDLRVSSSSTGHSFGVNFSNSSGLFERNTVRVAPSGNTRGLYAGGTGLQVEVYDSVFQVGAAVGGNPGNGSIGWDLQGSGQFAFTGNSVDVKPDVLQPGAAMAMSCSVALTGTFVSNIMGIGNHPSAMVLGTFGADCYDASTIRKNYWWNSGPGSLSASDQIVTISSADAGTFDVNGNIFNPKVSPYASTTSFELAANSVCLNRGEAGQRSDASPILLDYLRRPRTVDGGTDIGAAELQ
jgi:hypothetical protein